MNNITPLKDEETSSQQMLQKLMEDESFWDVELQGSDGVKVAANRAVIGAKSTILKNLLFGHFSEAQQAVVPVGFPGIVLKAVVEYIHTDNAALLENSFVASDIDWDSPSQVDAIKLAVGNILTLSEAAHYYGLPGLSKSISHRLSQVIQDVPPLALILLEAFHQTGPTVSQETQDISWKIIRSNADIVSSNAVKSLGSGVLELILQDNDLEASEYQLFQMIQLWRLHQEKEQKAISCHMTKYIKFENIKPSILSTTVAYSGLVLNRQLQAAYKAQALNSELKVGGGVFDKPRSFLPVWKDQPTVPDTPGTTKLLELETNPVIAGVFCWTLLVEDCDRDTWLGLLSRSAKTTTARKDFFGVCRDDITMLSYNGTKSGAEHRRELRNDLDALKFSPGAKVAFELDLTPDSHANGTLCASVNDGPLTKIFGDMKKYAEEDGILVGLVPALQWSERTRVRLLEVSHTLGNIPNEAADVVVGEQASDTEEQ